MEDDSDQAGFVEIEVPVSRCTENRNVYPRLPCRSYSVEHTVVTRKQHPPVPEEITEENVKGVLDCICPLCHGLGYLSFRIASAPDYLFSTWNRVSCPECNQKLCTSSGDPANLPA